MEILNKSEGIKVENMCNCIMKHLSNLYENEPEPIINTGYKTIDSHLRGLYAGTLTVLGARPSMGKSAVAMNLAVSMARTKKRVLYFNYEMHKNKFVERMICCIRGIRLSWFQDPGKERNDMIIQFMDDYLGDIVTQMEIVNSGNVSLEDISRITREKKANNELDVVMIDHFGLIRAGGQREMQGGLYERGTFLSAALKSLAMELEIPIIVVCQLNRQVESRTDKRPTMADLRDSGSIEQDADNVIMLHRPAYYDERKNKKELNVIFSKVRDGVTGSATMSMDLERMQLREWQRDEDKTIQEIYFVPTKGNIYTCGNEAWQCEQRGKAFIMRNMQTKQAISVQQWHQMFQKENATV